MTRSDWYRQRHRFRWRRRLYIRLGLWVLALTAMITGLVVTAYR